MISFEIFSIAVGGLIILTIDILKSSDEIFFLAKLVVLLTKIFLLSTMYLSVKFPVVPLLLSFAIYIIGAGTWIPYKRGLDDVGWFICYRHS